MTKKQLQDLVKRAAWTFLQAALAVLAVTDQPFSKAGLIAACAAGLSALKTFVVATTK